MSFWDNVFTGPTSQPVSPPITNGQPRAWWQDHPEGVYNDNAAHGQVYQQEQQHQGLTPQEIKQIRKRGHDKINAEQAEQIAEYDLATKSKYQNVCPQCGSGNYIPHGTRVAGVIMPTEKCFDCGLSARGPEMQVGTGNGKGSVAARQIDTGGASGSMFGKFNGIPRSYIPRA